MDPIHSLYLIFAALLFVPGCQNHYIANSCVKYLYKDYTCMIYNCASSDNFDAKNESISNDARDCQVSDPAPTKSTAVRKAVLFPSRFADTSSFFDQIDKQYKNGTYCYDPNNDHGIPVSLKKFYPSNNTIERAKICTIKKEDLNKHVRNFQQISAFVSPVFILIPIIIFMVTHEIQNVHGWTHFTNGCCVFALYTSWGLRYVLVRGERMNGTFRCIAFSIGQHYMHLSVFSWLVVACHDLQKLAESRPSSKSFDSKKQLTSYTKLATFGWGIPAGFMCFCKILGTILGLLGMSRESYFASFILPEYGIHRCFLAFNAYWLHLALPTSILFIIANFYNWRTLRIILQNKNDSSMEHAVQKVNVMRNMACLRAMVLTSFCWGCDVVRSIMIAYDRSGMLWFRVLLDTIIIYQTIPIFIIYSCRPHILNHLDMKYPALNCAIEACRTYFLVKRKEVDPDVVTQLRVHRKSDAGLIELT